MHINSLNIMKEFFATLPDKQLNILDVGSRMVEGQEHIGTYRQFCTNEKWSYTGIDIEAGMNVDVVMENGNEIPFDFLFDVIISGQTIEHVEYPWMWFREITRVLRPGGKCCIIAPAKIHEHRYPIDTYRYYPDGMRALAKWSGLEVIKVKRVVVDSKMEDTYLIATKI